MSDTVLVAVTLPMRALQACRPSVIEAMAPYVDGHTLRVLSEGCVTARVRIADLVALTEAVRAVLVLKLSPLRRTLARGARVEVIDG